MDTLEIRNESELSSVAQNVLKLLKEKGEGHAHVLALHGDLGSGKTAFVKALARELGVQEDVTSPTFVILKLYPLDEHHEYSVLAHIDAYRVDEVDEMRPLRFTELLKEEHILICIEWAEKIAELLPAHTLHMTLTIENEARIITFA